MFSVALETGLRIGDVLKIRKRDISQIAPDALKIAYIAQKTGKKGSCTLKGQTAWNWFKEAAKETGIDVHGVSPHALRKSFAVKLRHEQGMEAAKTALQHSDNATTAIYAYADVYAGKDPNAPVLWCQVNELAEIIAAKLQEPPC